METRAPFVIVGAFILAAIAAVFGFVYWLNNAGGLGARTSYNIQFSGPVPGLLVGAAVLFNGIRVGEVTSLALAADSPRKVNAVIAVSPDTPVRADTKVGLDFQGLTGVPVVALEGGTQLAASGPVPTLIAEPGAGQSMTQAARDALRRVDTILADNAEPLQGTIANLKTFSDGLARNTGKLDNIVAGLERMTGGGGAAAAPKIVYDLVLPQGAVTTPRQLKGQLVLSDPSAILMFDTQRILVTPPGSDASAFADVQWGDSIPKLVQAKLLQSFENGNVTPPPVREMDGVEADYRLLVEIRAFQIELGVEPCADIGLSARILGKDGRIIAARSFQDRRKLDGGDGAAAAKAFSETFGAIASNLVAWVSETIKR